MADKVRLGGMALANGVLVHGPTSWACAVRTPDGELKGRRPSGKRPRSKPAIENPLLRGPAKLFESVAFLPRLKKLLPEAKLPFERPRVLATMVGTAVVIHGVRRSRLSEAAKELLGGLLSFAPSVLALRGGELAAYHGAEHIAIGSYEHGELRAREHERCGTHLVGPLLVTGAAGNVLASRAPASLRPAAPRRGDGWCARGDDGDLRLDAAPSNAPLGAGTREAGPRVPAPDRDSRAFSGTAPGC